MANYLLITSAHKSEDLDKRKNDYLESLKTILPFKDIFDKIFILECLSDINLDYLKIDDKIEMHYSDSENFYTNYGLNELIHINNFLQKNTSINDDDTVVKVTGRYFLSNNDFLKQLPTSYDIIAKNDGDIWGNNSRGVHTFYMIFKKFAFNQLLSTVSLIREPNHLQTYCVEWLVKEYMNTNPKSHFSNGKIGIITNFSLNGLQVLT